MNTPGLVVLLATEGVEMTVAGALTPVVAYGGSGVLQQSKAMKGGNACQQSKFLQGLGNDKRVGQCYDGQRQQEQ